MMVWEVVPVQFLSLPLFACVAWAVTSSLESQFFHPYNGHKETLTQNHSKENKQTKQNKNYSKD